MWLEVFMVTNFGGITLPPMSVYFHENLTGCSLVVLMISIVALLSHFSPGA